MLRTVHKARKDKTISSEWPPTRQEPRLSLSTTPLLIPYPVSDGDMGIWLLWDLIGLAHL